MHKVSSLGRRRTCRCCRTCWWMGAEPHGWLLAHALLAMALSAARAAVGARDYGHAQSVELGPCGPDPSLGEHG